MTSLLLFGAVGTPREHREGAVVGELEDQQALGGVRVAAEAQAAAEELRYLMSSLWLWLLL